MAIRTLIGAAVSAGLLITASQALATNLIEDGGFELDAECGYNFVGTNSLGAWTVYGNVDKICKYWTPKSGAQSIDLNGSTPGTIEQSFSTTPGLQYELKIGYSGNPDRTTYRSADVDVFGSDLTTFTLGWDPSIQTNTRTDMKWKEDVSLFVATGNSASLRILSNGENTSWGLALDDISVTAKGYPIAIDIKPGSDPNCFNINGHGVIPVAILGSEHINVSEIDEESLSFGGLAVRVRGKAPGCSYEDVNSDGYSDLVCKFVDDSEFWSTGDGTADVTGTLNGYPIYGTDDICVVPATE